MTDDPKGPPDGRPPLNEALRLLAESERRSLGEHPTPEELAAYRNRELTEPEADRIRDHLALCHDCADLLLDLANFGHLEPPAGVAPASEEEVDRAWESLRSRIAESEAEAPKQLDRSAPVVQLRAVPPPAEPRRRNWQAWALAAMLILTLGLGGVWRLSHRPIAEIGPVREGVPSTPVEWTRGIGEIYSISSGSDSALSFDISDVSRIEILDKDKVLFEGTLTPAAPVVTIFRGGLEPGRYRVHLSSEREGQHSFTLQVDG
jgi:hypothetical protein